MRIQTLAVTATAIAATFVLAACGQSSDPGGMPGMDHGSSSSTSTPSTSVAADFNAADEMFATMMIPHHQQAVEMADLLLAKSDIDPEVTTLAQQIKDAQGPEIETMKGWLEDWGRPYDESDDMGGMDHSGGGMMSDEDMAALESATGADATRKFLEGMIMHHQGAVEMAQTEIDNGQNADALALAQQIIDTQNAEITTMQGLLEKL